MHANCHRYFLWSSCFRNVSRPVLTVFLSCFRFTVPFSSLKALPQSHNQGELSVSFLPASSLDVLGSMKKQQSGRFCSKRCVNSFEWSLWQKTDPTRTQVVSDSCPWHSFFSWSESFFGCRSAPAWSANAVRCSLSGQIASFVFENKCTRKALGVVFVCPPPHLVCTLDLNWWVVAWATQQEFAVWHGSTTVWSQRSFQTKLVLNPHNHWLPQWSATRVAVCLVTRDWPMYSSVHSLDHTRTQYSAQQTHWDCWLTDNANIFFALRRKNDFYFLPAVHPNHFLLFVLVPVTTGAHAEKMFPHPTRSTIETRRKPITSYLSSEPSFVGPFWCSFDWIYQRWISSQGLGGILTNGVFFAALCKITQTYMVCLTWSTDWVEACSGEDQPVWMNNFLNSPQHIKA